MAEFVAARQAGKKSNICVLSWEVLDIRDPQKESYRNLVIIMHYDEWKSYLSDL
jgi:hypothetical protein